MPSTTWSLYSPVTVRVHLLVLDDHDKAFVTYNIILPILKHSVSLTPLKAYLEHSSSMNEEWPINLVSSHLNSNSDR